MIKKLLFVLLILLLAVSSILQWMEIKKKAKVAFVRSQLVLEKYKGMEQASAIYQKKLDAWKSNFDSLEFKYNSSLQDYNSKISSGTLNKSEAAKIENNLKQQEEVVNSYGKSLEDKSTKENEKLTQGVLNQVNEYIKRYAEKSDFDIVLGVTLSGNILYGSDAIDITEEIIAGLNTEFEGK